jgi:mono/diheme cytochrome c family protein
MKQMKSAILILLLTTAALSGCEKKTPDLEFMPDMYDSPAFKAQEEDANSKDGSSARIPPEGTIPRGFQPYPFALEENEKAGKSLRNPLQTTKSNLERGQKLYNIYCIVCHGSKGLGDGNVVPPFPRPPSLLSDKVRQWADGNIYHVITKGQNLMPSYAHQIAGDDRWAVILYVRAMQRATNPTPEDLKELERMKQ